MILQAADEFTYGLILVAYLVHSHEQREPRMGKDRTSLASRQTPYPSTPYSPAFELRRTLALNFPSLRMCIS